MPTVRDCLASLLLIAIAGITTPPGHATPKGAQAGKPAEVVTRGQREAKDIRYGSWQSSASRPAARLRCVEPRSPANSRPDRRPCASI